MWMPGATELIVIGFFGLLVFGNRLPKVARSVGSSFIEFKKGLKGVEDETNDILGEIEDTCRETQKQIAETKQEAKDLLK